MLGIVVYTVGRVSETYIARHIEGLAPGRTAVCSLTACENPRWSSTAPVLEVHRPRHRLVRGTRRALDLVSQTALRKFDDARFAAWLAKNHVRVVLCEYLQVSLAVLDLCQRLRIPVIAHAHGYDVTGQVREPGWAERYSARLRYLSEIVVVSQDMRSRVLAYGVPAQKIHVIPCGTVVFSTERAPTVAKASQSIVAVGRLVAKKGPLFLLETFRRIRLRVPDVSLRIIGDGEFGEPMRQYVRATGLENAVQFLGALPHDEVCSELQGADLFLQHSVTAESGDQEGLPVSILEAMAAAVPVVATRHAGIPEVVLEGRTGFLVAEGDVRGMAERAVLLLEDPELRLQLGEEGRRTVLDRFTADRELEQLRDILRIYWPECERSA